MMQRYHTLLLSLGAVFTVRTTTWCCSSGTLWDAVNRARDGDRIVFDIRGGTKFESWAYAIYPAGSTAGSKNQVYFMDSGVTLDASTQTSTGLTRKAGDPRPRVILNMARSSYTYWASGAGIRVWHKKNIVIKDFGVVGSKASGLLLAYAENVQVEGGYYCDNARYGIELHWGTKARLGVDSPTANPVVISGNKLYGIFTSETDSVFLNMYVGVDYTGMKAKANSRNGMQL